MSRHRTCPYVICSRFLQKFWCNQKRERHALFARTKNICGGCTWATHQMERYLYNHDENQKDQAFSVREKKPRRIASSRTRPRVQLQEASDHNHTQIDCYVEKHNAHLVRHFVVPVNSRPRSLRCSCISDPSGKYPMLSTPIITSPDLALQRHIPSSITPHPESHLHCLGMSAKTGDKLSYVYKGRTP